MVAAMDAVGVDSAILVSPFTIYRYDASYALEVHERHSARFALVKPVDPANPHVATAPSSKTASGWLPEYIKDLFRRS